MIPGVFSFNLLFSLSFAFTLFYINRFMSMFFLGVLRYAFIPFRKILINKIRKAAGRNRFGKMPQSKFMRTICEQ